jgi:hypothetical protein
VTLAEIIVAWSVVNLLIGITGFLVMSWPDNFLRTKVDKETEG